MDAGVKNRSLAYSLWGSALFGFNTNVSCRLPEISNEEKDAMKLWESSHRQGFKRKKGRRREKK